MKKSILAESRMYGWPSAETCPHPEMREYLAACRRAVVAGKTVSHSGPEYRAYAAACERNASAPAIERRSFAQACLKKLFPTTRSMSIEDKFVREFGYEPRRLHQQTDSHVETQRKELAALGIF